jgi:2-methylisocitrate lyase-like PEP mutase family enzyme
MSQLNTRAQFSRTAKSFKDLHIPGQPLVLANIWDVSSLNAVVSLNAANDAKPVKAIATASWAIAAALGVKDDDLTSEQNLAAIASIALRAEAVGLPLTVDLQDGYGPRIASMITAVIEAGACGANIEDSRRSAGLGASITGSLYSKDEQISRIKTALAAAKDAGCADFTVNARCDVFRLEPAPANNDEVAMAEAIDRGKAYLEAGATTVFYWGGPRGLLTEEVEKLVKELDGRVAVKLSLDGLSVQELARIGVARISVGPSLMQVAMEAVKKAAIRFLSGGQLGS